jgi:hypothetical protein
VQVYDIISYYRSFGKKIADLVADLQNWPNPLIFCAYRRQSWPIAADVPLAHPL